MKKGAVQAKQTSQTRLLRQFEILKLEAAWNWYSLLNRIARMMQHQRNKVKISKDRLQTFTDRLQ